MSYFKAFLQMDAGLARNRPAKMSIHFDILRPESETGHAVGAESCGHLVRAEQVRSLERSMTDGPETSRKGQRVETERPVATLASEALRVLVRQRGAGPKRLSEDWIGLLRTGVLGRTTEQREDAISDLMGSGLKLNELIDLYIPEVARRLGEEWCTDQTSFADVTIGAARLQGMLRDLLQDVYRKHPPKDTGGIAVAVLAGESHTLGAMIITAQLRRLGVSVRLVLSLDLEEAALNLAGEDRFDAIMISASHVESLVQVGKFVEKLRQKTNRSIPIVVGGPVMGTGKDVKAVTGADFATSDVVEALRLCQLKISPHVAGVNAKVG
ncbi:hypothetical protein GQ651_18180 [Alphaproteobacteria bacterium GH1-50]|uniref:B12-binding domain-containing protein n=1 Tax=Kangsaoukella pontilimi TaxID=2691042 RepID=A0A7C9NGY6_9RHOB|nr:cobalamin B12-binding domain-containing protein [Kangsaoukella pontilimi]MXQ09779.1 hypothetical protein [Kangsaoukella pontilimi]